VGRFAKPPPGFLPLPTSPSPTLLAPESHRSLIPRVVGQADGSLSILMGVRTEAGSDTFGDVGPLLGSIVSDL
jgi:hypothetical protein